MSNWYTDDEAAEYEALKAEKAERDASRVAAVTPVSPYAADVNIVDDDAAFADRRIREGAAKDEVLGEVFGRKLQAAIAGDKRVVIDAWGRAG